MLNARTAAALDSTAAELRATYKVEVTAVPADIATDSGRTAVLAVCPAPDILVNNAGGPAPGSLAKYTEEDWTKAIDGNPRAPAALMAAVLDGMAGRGFGRVVNITSKVVRHPIDVQGLSAAARSGLHLLVSTLVRGYVGRNDTINNILPGPFATDRLDQQLQLSGEAERDLAAGRVGRTPVRATGAALRRADGCGQGILIDGAADPQII